MLTLLRAAAAAAAAAASCHCGISSLKRSVTILRLGQY